MKILISLALILMTATGQILLKKGARIQKGNNFLNVFAASGYIFFLVTIVLSYYFMKIIPMKYFTVIMSSSYVAVMIGAKLFLNENIKKDRIIGTILIASGVIVFLIK